ncbi:MAG: beta-Ala-His dipeptidase [Halieaceae bacterium]|nr:beta-Ala-His dipeptidase [Halieaceae bacterium]
MKPAQYPGQPAHIWEHFYQFTRIPRPSGQEAAVRQYVIDLAEQAGHSWHCDSAGNLAVAVPATAGLEQRPVVIIQNHLDMVTVKSGDKSHDFTTQPLDLVVDYGWLRADRTTLGADNGLGCAAALALMTDATVAHPPLQLLFTVDEETGLGGALYLDPQLLAGSVMLNLDTEDWNELYVGCAGGNGLEMRRQFATAPCPAGAEQWQLSLKGLAGGHSGIQIQEQLGNAIKLLAQCLEDVDGLQLAAFDAGVAHNVIPREGSLAFTCAAGQGEALRSRLEALRTRWLGYLPAADAALQLQLQPATVGSVIGTADTRRLLDLVAAFPHGAQAYNLTKPAELVDLSCNLARLRLEQGSLFLETSYRFFNEDQSLPLRQALLGLGRAFKLEVTETVGYPGWQPDFDSPLLQRAVALHRRLFGHPPAVKAIHAGLECGILKGKQPGLDILSFGPTIRGAHSPTERLEIATVEPFWRFLTALLAEL